jgi:hypothetical protein
LGARHARQSDERRGDYRPEPRKISNAAELDTLQLDTGMQRRQVPEVDHSRPDMIFIY